MLRESITEIDGVEIIVMPVREYRFGIVLRGENLSPEVDETDPQLTGLEPPAPIARAPEARRTAEIIEKFIEQANSVLIGGAIAYFIRLIGSSSLL